MIRVSSHAKMALSYDELLDHLLCYVLTLRHVYLSTTKIVIKVWTEMFCHIFPHFINKWLAWQYIKNQELILK